MKKRLSLIIALTLVLISLFTLGFSNNKLNAATLTDQEKVKQEVENIVMPEMAIIDFPVVSVSAYGSTIEWESSNSNVLDVPQNGGWVTVTRPTDADATVTLTVKITLNQASQSKDFEILVPKGVTQTNTYDITYKLNGGTQNANNPIEYQVGETQELYAPTKGTVAFLGWYDNAEFEGSAITELPKGLSGEYTLYAKWDVAVVTSIEVTENPKTNYVALEKFDPTGIKVKAYYNDNTSRALSDEEIEGLTYDKDVLHGNDTVVTVTFEGKTAEINVEVSKRNYDMSGISFVSASKEYNGAAQQLSITGTLPAGLTVVYTGSATNVNDGAQTITATFVNANEVDYNTPQAMTAQLTITKANMTVSAVNKSMKVGAALPTFEAVVEGAKTQEDKALALSNVQFECDATASSPAGEYDITIVAFELDNYNVTVVKGTLSISDGTYTIEPDSVEVDFNGQNQMFEATFKDGEEVIDSVELTYTVDNQSFTGATNVGTYTVKVSYDDPTYGAGYAYVTFTIRAVQLQEDMFEDLEKVSHTGQAIEPKVSGKFGEYTLTEGVDYTLSYENNVAKGTASVIITPVANGNFDLEGNEDYVVKTFEIWESELERVTETKEQLENEHSSLNGKYENAGNLPVYNSTYEADIFWMSTSTAMSVNEEGKVSVILTNEEQTVVLYAVITAGNAAEYSMFTVVLPALTNTSDEESDVTVEGVQSGAEVQVEETDGTEAGFVVEGNEEVVIGYEITLQENGQTVQPMTEVTVKVPVPAGYDVDTLKVYYCAEGEEPVDMNAAVEGEYLVFTTTHFSKYIVVGEPEEVEEETAISIEEFLNKEVNAEVYYELTGVITKVSDPTYGNITITDKNNLNISVDIYGLTETKVSSNDKSFASLGLNIGDLVTLMTVRSEYNGTAQGGGKSTPAYHVSHISPEWTVEASSNGNGEVTLSSEKVENGDKVTLTFAPAEGYEASTMTVNGQEVGIKGQTSYEYQVMKDVVFVVTFAEIKENTGEATWSLVTSTSELKAGDQIVIVSSANAKALSTTQNTNNRGQIDIVVNGNTVVIGNGVQIITIENGQNEGTFALRVDNGYLYAAGGTGKNNYLRTETSKTVSDVLVLSWNITIDANGIATIVSADSTVARNTMKYNKTSSLFSCYASGQEDISIYKLSGSADVPTHEHVACPTCGLCTSDECNGTDGQKCTGHEVTPSHEHDVCGTCGGCQANDCDGTLETCPGHSSSSEDPVSGTIKLTSPALSKNMDGTNQADQLCSGIDTTKWSIVGDKGSAQNNVGLYSDIRLYGHSNGGNSLTITSEYNIDTITLTSSGSSYSNYKVYVNGEEVSGVDGTFTINASSFVIKNANSDNTQVRFKEITINYSSKNSN